MKIVYEKTIAEKMKDVISDSQINGRKIEKFILTRKEFDDLITYTPFYPPYKLGENLHFMGYVVEIEK